MMASAKVLFPTPSGPPIQIHPLIFVGHIAVNGSTITIEHDVIGPNGRPPRCRVIYDAMFA
jgi:hypothetical protein